MKKILIPVDFSKSSEYAAKLASKISTDPNNEIHLLHMVELPSGFVDMGTGANISIPESMLYIRKVREKLLKYKNKFFPDNQNIKHAIRFQNPYEGIRDYSKKAGISLTVMGSKGLSDLEEMIIGSNTEKVVRNSESPVLVVKKDAENFNPKNIVFASDFEFKSENAFERLLDFTQHTNSKIHLLKINTPSKFENTHASIEKIKDFISTYDVPEHTINVYNDDTTESGILHFANNIDADLIALATHGRSGLSHMFNRSVTKHITKLGLRPLLTFRV